MWKKKTKVEWANLPYSWGMEFGSTAVLSKQKRTLVLLSSVPNTKK